MLKTFGGVNVTFFTVSPEQLISQNSTDKQLTLARVQEACSPITCLCNHKPWQQQCGGNL